MPETVPNLNPNEKKVYDAIKKLGATSEDKVKSADDIMKAAAVGKAIVTSALQTLAQKGLVKRVARQKSAGYYALK
ncbi:MAG: transcriptional regulator [Thermoplasmataceae archaeon]